jgi:hypothetical protein
MDYILTSLNDVGNVLNRSAIYGLLLSIKWQAIRRSAISREK